MFTGNMSSLPTEQYLSAALLARISQAIALIEADKKAGETVVIEEGFNYTIVDATCTSPVGKPAEIHVQYIDVHYVLEGIEHIGYTNQPFTVTDYSKESKDLYLGPLEEEGYVSLVAGEFATFFPGEVHKPLSDYTESSNTVKKAIIKIAYDKL